jgi:hypothetical protein
MINYKLYVQDYIFCIFVMFRIINMKKYIHVSYLFFDIEEYLDDKKCFDPFLRGDKR